MSELATQQPRIEDIEVRDGQLMPTKFVDLQRMANMMLSTGMLPQGCDNLAKAILLVTKASELGIPFTQVSTGMMIVRNKPAVWGDTALGLVTRSNECAGLEETIEGEGEKMLATCKVVRVKLCVDGQYARIPTVRSFSVDDAKKAKLWGKAGPWQDYPKRMLAMRARAFAIRDSFPDLLNGLGVVEEVQDYPPDNRVVEAERAAEITNTIAGLALPKADEPIEPPPEPANDADAKLFGEVGADIAKGRKL